jgi:hypothetical protein
MTPIENEVQELLTRFAGEKRQRDAAKEAERQERIRETRIELRNKVRNGDCETHFQICPECLAAILTLSKIKCQVARSSVHSKWRE